MTDKQVINIYIGGPRVFSGKIRSWWKDKAKEARVQRQLDEFAKELNKVSPEEDGYIPITLRAGAEIKAGMTLEEQDEIEPTKLDLIKATPHVAKQTSQKLSDKFWLFVARNGTVSGRVIGVIFGKEYK